MLSAHAGASMLVELCSRDDVESKSDEGRCEVVVPTGCNNAEVIGLCCSATNASGE